MNPRDRELLDKQTRGGLPPCARRRVHDYIVTHLDQKITNDTLAQIAGLSTAHFCTVFKQTEGMSPHHYVLQFRVRRTQQLLASTEMSVAEIADAVGFSNQSHWIQSFRKIVGVTPGGYRTVAFKAVTIQMAHSKRLNSPDLAAERRPGSSSK
jgi:AraC family transcriptional regulator